MSLVGSLEDLGLGEILQIVSLSGKSGVLCIRSPHGEGRIVFDRGAIRGALVRRRSARSARAAARAPARCPRADLEALARRGRRRRARASRRSLVARTALDAARLDELRERHVETQRCCACSRGRCGEFRFEISDESGDPTGADLLLRAGHERAVPRARRHAPPRRDRAGRRRAGRPEQRRRRRRRAMEIAFDGEASSAPTSRSSCGAATPEAPAEMEITILELLDDEIDDARHRAARRAIEDELARRSSTRIRRSSGEERERAARRAARWLRSRRRPRRRCRRRPPRRRRARAPASWSSTAISWCSNG